MITVNDVKVDYKTERANGRVVVTMLVDDTKVVNKTSLPEDHYVDDEVERAKIRMRSQYDEVLRKKYFDSSRGHFIGQSLHAIPKSIALWWDDGEFYLVTESPLAAAYCERMTEGQALQWARAYLKLEMPDGFAIKPVEETVN